MTENAKLPIETCPDCLTIYAACPMCGNCEPRTHAGKPCRCGHGTLELKEHRFCCKRAWHHIGSTCKHCGQKD